MPRFFCDLALVPGDALALPPAAARHVQVLRLQARHPVLRQQGDKASVDMSPRQQVVGVALMDGPGLGGGAFE